MAAAITQIFLESFPVTKVGCVKDLVASNTLTSIPSRYAYNSTPTEEPVVAEEPIPIIDFSLLISASSAQRSLAVQQLGKACSDWGFFMVINHGVPERLRKDMLNACQRFFDMTEEEKLGCSGTHVLDPIRYGTSFNSSVEKVFFWRDYLKVIVHPEFHSPRTPFCFSVISLEYSKRTREVARELLKGISESLGLDELYIDKEMELESGLQILAANLYPPCPQPELALGLPPHSDHRLLTLLIQNEVGGLQLKHNGKWFHVNALPKESHQNFINVHNDCFEENKDWNVKDVHHFREGIWIHSCMEKITLLVISTMSSMIGTSRTPFENLRSLKLKYRLIKNCLKDVKNFFKNCLNFESLIIKNTTIILNIHRNLVAATALKNTDFSVIPSMGRQPMFL